MGVNSFSPNSFTSSPCLLCQGRSLYIMLLVILLLSPNSGTGGDPCLAVCPPLPSPLDSLAFPSSASVGAASASALTVLSLIHFSISGWFLHVQRPLSASALRLFWPCSPARPNTPATTDTDRKL